MKHIATMALMFNLAVASVYAQQNPVKMVFSGTAAASTINLQQPNTSNDRANGLSRGRAIASLAVTKLTKGLD